MIVLKVSQVVPMKRELKGGIDSVIVTVSYVSQVVPMKRELNSKMKHLSKYK